MPLEAGACPLGARLHLRVTGRRAQFDAGGWVSDSDVGAILWNADTGARLVTVATGDWQNAGRPGAVFTP